MNAWTVGVTGGRGDAVGVAVLMELVVIPVEVDVSGWQTKVADVVIASVAVVVGVVTYNVSS